VAQGLLAAPTALGPAEGGKPGDLAQLLSVHEIVGHQQEPTMYRVRGIFALGTAASTGYMGYGREATRWCTADEFFSAMNDGQRRNARPLMELVQCYTAQATEETRHLAKSLGMGMHA